MPRSPLTESIQKVRRLVTEIQGTLTVDEFNLLLDELVPEPEPLKPATKKSNKKSSKSSQSETERVFKRCDTCGLTKRADVHKDSQLGGYHEFIEKKSPRASGIHAQLKERRQEQRETARDDDDDIARCVMLIYDHGRAIDCNRPADDNVHHLRTHPDHHPFVATAPPAPAPSPANGGVGSTTANSRTQPEDVGTVAHGASGGD